MLKEIVRDGIYNLVDKSFFIKFNRIEELAKGYGFEKVADCGKVEGTTGSSFSCNALVYSKNNGEEIIVLCDGLGAFYKDKNTKSKLNKTSLNCPYPEVSSKKMREFCLPDYIRIGRLDELEEYLNK